MRMRQRPKQQGFRCVDCRRVRHYTPYYRVNNATSDPSRMDVSPLCKRCWRDYLKEERNAES